MIDCRVSSTSGVPKPTGSRPHLKTPGEGVVLVWETGPSCDVYKIAMKLYSVSNGKDVSERGEREAL